MAIRPRSPIIAEEGPQSGIGSQPLENRPKFLQSWQIILSTDHQTLTPGQSTLSFLINYLIFQALSLQGKALNFCTDCFAVTCSAAYYMTVNALQGQVKGKQHEHDRHGGHDWHGETFMT